MMSMAYAMWARNWVRVLAVIGVLVLAAMIITFSVGVSIAIDRDASNEVWLVIGTAVYAVFSVLTFGVLLIAAIGALRQLNLADQERRLGILLELSSRWDSATLRAARRIVNSSGENLLKDSKKYLDSNDPKLYLLLAVANFFEDIGIVTIKRRLWSVEEASDRFGPSVVYYHDLFSDYIKDEQAKDKDDRFLEYFSKLAVELRKRGT